MPTPTTYMSLQKPTVGGDANSWGTYINSDLDLIDALAVYSTVPVSATGALAVYAGPALIEATGGGGGITLTLPDATVAANKGRTYLIVKVDAAAGAITVNPFSGGQTISGLSSLTISAQWTGYAIQSNGATWVIVGVLPADITGILAVSGGGTGSNLSATGGTSQVLKQTTVGGNITVGQLAFSDLSGSISGTQIPAATITVAMLASVEGNGTKVQLTSAGTTVSGDVVTYDGSGNVQDSGTLLSSLAPLASPTFTGTVTIPTAHITDIATYNGQTTAGNGIASVVASTSQKAESAADANVLTFTPPAAAGSYRIRFILSVSVASAATLGWTATWKDSNGNAQTPTNLSLTQSGAAPSALTFTTSAASNYYGQADIDIDSSATNVVVQLTFTGTSFTAKASATIERII